MASYPSGGVMPRSAQMSALYFLVNWGAYSMGISETSDSPVRILAAILPVATPRS